MATTSLRRQLLHRLLPAMLALLLAGAGTAYWVAWRSATKAYDRALFDIALAIAEQLRQSNPRPSLPLTPQARAVLLTDKYDAIFYAVRGPGGELLDGDGQLPLPPPRAPRAGDDSNRTYYDGARNGQPIRLAALADHMHGQPVTILAGETLVKRNALVREILLGMLLPELLLIAVSLVLVAIGVRAGLRPLSGLRQELAGRSQNDLSPVRVDVPEEMQPVVNEINALLQRLSHSLASQRDFISNAAHQLRTPIAALQAQVEASLRGGGGQRAEELAGILGAMQRLSHLVDQLLALARAEPALAQTANTLALEDLVQHAAETQMPRIIAGGLDFACELAEISVRGNALLLEELLFNLLDNAVRHTPEGGSVLVRSGKTATEIWLTVEDSGPGIPPGERERIFERFYQSATGRREGSGLGLAIVREIARQHGGSIAAGTSERLGGACLRLSLPLAD